MTSAIGKSDDLETVKREAQSISAGVERIVDQLAKQIGAASHARAVFGEPVSSEGVTVIPVARVVAGFGAGAGSGMEATADQGVGGGAGAGGGFVVTAVGIIEISAGRARFVRTDRPLGLWRDLAELLVLGARRAWTRAAQPARPADPPGRAS